MEGESGFTRNIIDELHSWNIQRDQNEGESGVTRSIIDEIHSSDIQGEQIEAESGVTRSISDELHAWDIQGDEMEGESMALLEGSFTNYILWISKEMKREVKVVLLEVSLMNLFFGYPTRSNGR